MWCMISPEGELFNRTAQVSSYWGYQMIKKSLTIVVATVGLLIVGGPAAFAADIELCTPEDAVANAGGVSLASTGAGIDVKTWLIAGIALLAVGATLAIVAPRRRRDPLQSSER